MSAIDDDVKAGLPVSNVETDKKYETHTDEWATIRAQAKTDEDVQHDLTLWKALITYKTAVFWSLVASMTIIMESYDLTLLGSSYASPAFREKFGVYTGKAHGYQIPAQWQAGCSQAATVGSIIGCYLGAGLIERFGYRRTICGGLLWLCPFIGLVTFAPNLTALCCGEILCGIPWGIFSTGAAAYASEICPMVLRGYLTTFVNLCWGIGHFIAAGVLLAAQGKTGIYSYRLPFLIQWIWPLPLFIGMALAPESPWWLVRVGRLEDAEKVLDRINGGILGSNKDAVAMMVLTNQHEIDHAQGAKFRDMFKGVDRRRTEISVMAWVLQIFSGAPFAGNSTYFFEQAGMSTKKAFTLTLINYGLACFGTILSWFLLANFGRRTIFTTGLFLLSVVMALIGVLSIIAEKGNNAAMWGQGGMMIFWTFSYYCSIGPLTYCIVGETSSTRLRNKTIALSRIAYNCMGITFGVLTPYMLHPDKWNWKGRTGWFWAPICLCGALWAFFRLPEMKNRSFYELDVLFANRVSARKFKSFKVRVDQDTVAEDEASSA